MNGDDKYSMNPDFIIDNYVEKSMNYDVLYNSNMAIIESVIEIDKLSEKCKQILTQDIMDKIVGLKNDIINDKADFLIPENPETFYKIDGKAYHYSDGINYSAKYTSGNGFKIIY